MTTRRIFKNDAGRFVIEITRNDELYTRNSCLLQEVRDESDAQEMALAKYPGTPFEFCS